MEQNVKSLNKPINLKDYFCKYPWLILHTYFVSDFYVWKLLIPEQK